MAQYNAHRREFRSNTTLRHHIAWGIVCVLLGTIMLALWTSTQSLQRENTRLKKQLSAAVQQPTTTCRLTGTWPAGTTKHKTVTTPNGTREFLVHTPAGFSNQHYYPLLLFYPGKGATADGAQAAYGLDGLPAIVVYPFPSQGTDGITAWQGAPYSSSADDVSYTVDMLDKLQSELCIDRTKIYAVGLSNGGGFASLLSCRLPDRFAAYAIIAGALYYPNGECKPPRPTPVLSIHGDTDPTVPYLGSVFRHLPPIYDWTAMRAHMNGCQKATDQQIDPTIVTTTWTECRDGATVQNVRVHGGGHKWGQVSNDYLWQFLSRFSR